MFVGVAPKLIPASVYNNHGRPILQVSPRYNCTGWLGVKHQLSVPSWFPSPSCRTAQGSGRRHMMNSTDGIVYWSINKSSGLEKTHCLRFPSALHQERSIPQLFNAFEGSGHRLEPLLDHKGRVYSVGGRHTTTQRAETLANCYRSCRSVRYLSPCPNLGRCPVIFCFCLWVPCYVS